MGVQPPDCGSSPTRGASLLSLKASGYKVAEATVTRSGKMVHNSEEIKRIVLNRISVGEDWVTSGRAKYRKDPHVIHVRFCSIDRSGSHHYKFNINPNTLSADYEVWICGNADTYYLIPIQIMRQIYHDPESYVDSRHPEIRVVSVNAGTNTVTYATGGRTIDITAYLHRTL